MEEQQDSVPDLFAVIEADPIGGARLCREQIKADDDSVHVRRRRRIAEGYLIASRLKENYELWQRFVSEPFFDKDTRIRKKDDTRFQLIVTRTVMIYLFSVLKSNTSLRNRMWRYARAMDHYAEQKVPPEKVVERIKVDGGIEKVCASISKGRSVHDEDDDWKAEMRSRAHPDEHVTEEFEEEELELLPEEPADDPTVCLALDEEGLKYLRKLKLGTNLYIIASKLRIDDEGRMILRVSEIDDLDNWGSGYREAMKAWEKEEEDEGFT